LGILQGLFESRRIAISQICPQYTWAIRMTSVQSLPPVISKSHHSISSPIIKPSANAFRKTKSLENMNGAATTQEQSDNGAPAGSSDQVRQNWERFGDAIQKLLREPLQFVQYTEKDQINPEEKYTAVNQVARKINGHSAVVPSGVRLRPYHRDGLSTAANLLLVASHSLRLDIPSLPRADPQLPHLLPRLRQMQIIPSQPVMTFIPSLSILNGLIREITLELRDCITSAIHVSQIRCCKF
jgi:hypothetical protein